MDGQSSREDGVRSDGALFIEARRIAGELLDDSAGGAACLALVETLQRLADETARQRRDADQPAIACRNGCDHCCHMRVVATVPEVAAIVAYAMRHLPPEQVASLRRRIAAIEESGPAMSDEEWGVRGVPCPFLADGACTVYPARPLECRGYTSTSLAACEAARAHYLDWEVPMHLPGFTPYKYVQAAILQALGGAGLAPHVVELSRAVGLMLADPGALDRWGAGEPAFEDAELPPWDPERRAFLPWTPSDELRGVEAEE